MASLTKAQIDELKEKGFITQVVPSDDLASKTVDGLKIEEYVTVTDPSADIEAAVAHTIPVTGVTIEGPDPINVGHTVELTGIIVEPEDATNQNVTVVSSDESVATVSYSSSKNTWRVTGVAGGTATITVTTEDGGFTDTCEVLVHEE